MRPGPSHKRSVTPEQTIKILREKGIEINENEAAEILDFLYFLAKLTVNQNVKTTSLIEKGEI